MFRALLISFVLLPSLAPSLLAQPTLSRGLGPFEEWITALAVDPHDPEVAWAGSYEDCAEGPCGRGILISNDGGASWSPAGPRGVSGLENSLISRLAVDPESTSTLYAVAALSDEPRRLFRSEDGGETWSATTLPGDGVGEIEIARDSSIYATADGFLYRSLDRGDTWAGHPISPAMEVLDLAVDTRDAARIYAVGEAGIARSSNAGQTWRSLDDRFTLAVEIDPENPSVLYAVRLDESTFVGLERSSDGGNTWTELENAPEPLQGSVFGPSAFLRLDPWEGTLFLGTREEIWQSADGGASWSAPNPMAGNDLTAFATGPGVALAGFRNGVRRLAPGETRWRSANRGLRPAVTDRLAIDPERRTIYASMFSLGTVVARSRDLGESWDHLEIVLDFPLGKSLQVVDLALERLPPELDAVPAVYAAVSLQRGIWRSLDEGESWTRVFDRGERVVVDPADPDTVYVAGESVWKSVDRGESWRRTPLPADGLSAGEELRDLTLVPGRSDVLYLATTSRLLRSLDAAASWQEIDPPAPGAALGPVAADPHEPERVIFNGVEPTDVARSLDGGSTWERVSLGISPLDLAVSPVDPSSTSASAIVWASTVAGLARSVDRGARWLPVRLTSFETFFEIEAAPVDPGEPQTVYGATSAGVQQIEVFESRRLGLRGGRFVAEVEWRDGSGKTGFGQVAAVFEGTASVTGEVSLRSSDSAVLRFFTEDNWEMLLKVLDGRAVNDAHWVSLAAATDAGYTVEITDTACGTVAVYEHPAGTAAPSVVDTLAFPECPVRPPGSCEVSGATFCFGDDGRFSTVVRWHDALGQGGPAWPARRDGFGFAASDDSGLFYFFSPENWELLVKVLDGCAINGRYWVFGAATTDVEYTLTVTDTLTGERAEYFNPLGTAADAITDTAAFACP